MTSKSIEEFYLSQDRFSGLSITEQISRFAWFLHNERSLEKFGTSDLTALYRELHLKVPPISVYLPRLSDRSPPILLKKRGSYVLEGRERGRLDDILREHPTVVVVSRMLSDLVARIEDPAEKAFLTETMRCYKAGAFRAAIVMVWNLGFYHLRDWIWADRARIDSFNMGILKRYPKSKIQIETIIDFDDLKEFEFLEVCQTSRLISKNIAELLKEKLKRRNGAAHPSSVVFSQMQADDFITDIVGNIIEPFCK